MGSNILCDNVLIGATIVSDDSEVNYPFANAINNGTAQQVGFNGQTNHVILDLLTTHTIDSIGIAKHNIYSASSGVGYIAVSKGDTSSGPWTEIVRLTPSSDAVSLNSSTLAYGGVQYLRITVENNPTPTQDIYIGNITVGDKIEISDGQYIGFTEPKNSNKYKLISNITRGGEIVGIMREAKAVKCKVQAKHLTKTWVDSNWPNIAECISKYPFYFEWENGAQPIYGWASNVTPPSFTTINRQEFSIDMEGMI